MNKDILINFILLYECPEIVNILNYKLENNYHTFSIPALKNTGSYNKNNGKSDTFFLEDSDLDEDKKKWCRCVLKVATKETGECLKTKAWFKKIEGKSCYNPYSVCSKTVGTSTKECSQHYDFNKFSDQRLIAYVQLHHIDVPDPYNRTKTLNNIYEWKKSKYKS